jgi:hypothetical protein
MATKIPRISNSVASFSAAFSNAQIKSAPVLHTTYSNVHGTSTSTRADQRLRFLPQGSGLESIVGTVMKKKQPDLKKILNHKVRRFRIFHIHRLIARSYKRVDVSMSSIKRYNMPWTRSTIRKQKT